MEQRDGRSAAGILSGRSFNAQCLEHCVFGAPIENQVEAADELGRNRAKIRCRRDREQNLFSAAVKAHLQKMGQLIGLDDRAADADFAKNSQIAEGRPVKRDRKPADEMRKVNVMGCLLLELYRKQNNKSTEHESCLLFRRCSGFRFCVILLFSYIELFIHHLIPYNGIRKGQLPLQEPS